MSKRKIVLAYSGGLDTSFCIPYLVKERGFDVYALTVNTGGFSESEIRSMKERAVELGAKTFECLDVVQEYYGSCIKYLLYGNILRYQTYPLSVSAERVFQAEAVVKYAEKIGAAAIAHGSTGAGNDQVRFDMAFEILGDGLEIVTPIRDLKLSRKQEVQYLKEHGLDAEWEKAKYSINAGLWGTTIGGDETLTSHLALPDDAYLTRLSETNPQVHQLHFQKGELHGIDGEEFDDPVKAIQHLDQLAAPFAIGRDIHVGDTIIGIKGRVAFEAAAPLIMIKAHHLLEKHVLTKWQMYWKEQLANWYGMLMHEGQFWDPVMRNIETFLTDTQDNVSGEVHVRFLPKQFELMGVTSDFDMMQSNFGQYGEENKGWSGEDVRGFTKILANSSKIYHSVNSKK